MEFDAVLIQSFGGPEQPDDVIPFLENVLRGRPVAPGRIEQIAAHYMEFGGRSPINDHNRALVSAVRDELARRGRPLPVYWGNRNWYPYLRDTVAAMAADGVRSAAVFATSAYASYSGCRQYLDDLAAAREAVEATLDAGGTAAPALWKLRPFYDRPGFVGPLAAGLRDALHAAGRPDTPILMTAHSIPAAQAAACDYEMQLRATAEMVAGEASAPTGSWSLVFQSRSGPPTQPWLGPDIVEVINAWPAGRDEVDEVIVVPIGFVSDHMEVVYDLDHQAAAAAAARGIRLVRTATPGVHPDFVAMMVDLIDEAAVAPERCPPGCCPAQRAPQLSRQTPT